FLQVLLCSLIAAAAATSDDANAEVKHFQSDVSEHGFQYAYDTTNAIHAAAAGSAYGEHNGDFSWISPEGEHVAIQYVADENGYQPSGDILPTPPPIPEAILKALEYIRTHPRYEEEPVRKQVVHHGAKNYGRRF
ncbi:larval cuticle protein 4-like, partial [Musca domestica]|uniref:Larval cuticle protein 4-like n=1 Tax=Musca domestica TaxID=7370 RepID=A0ABM3V104_MUSDO